MDWPEGKFGLTLPPREFGGGCFRTAVSNGTDELMFYGQFGFSDRLG